MFEIVNPATGKAFRKVHGDNEMSIKTKFQTAQSFQVDWAKTSFSERSAMIKKFAKLLEDGLAECAEIQAMETGKPISQARAEIRATQDRISFFLENTERFLKEQTVFKDEKNKMTEMVSKEPLGVVANISSWNYPYFVGSNVFIPALLTGNCVLYKPSEFAWGTGLKIGELMHAAGIPQEAFQVIVGDGKLGASVLKYPINAVFFTGSYQTGVKIAQAVAPQLVKMGLELGGKDPVYCADDINVQQVAEITADGTFYNTGQSCCSVERIYIHEKVYDQFVSAFCDVVSKFKIGDPLQEDTYIGPLTRKAQIAILENQIDNAVRGGAQVILGGNAIEGPGNYFEPTVLVGLNHSMNIMCQESFGPIIGLQKVGSDEEAVKLMNQTQFGLTAGVFTKDQERAKDILSQMHAGTVYWNCCDRVSPRLPWSGRKHSGLGSTLGEVGIEAFLQPKAWHMRQL